MRVPLPINLAAALVLLYPAYVWAQAPSGGSAGMTLGSLGISFAALLAAAVVWGSTKKTVEQLAADRDAAKKDRDALQRRMQEMLRELDTVRRSSSADAARTVTDAVKVISEVLSGEVQRLEPKVDRLDERLRVAEASMIRFQAAVDSMLNELGRLDRLEDKLTK